MPKKKSASDYPQWTPADTDAINDAASQFAIKMSLLDFANKTSLNGPPFIIGSTNWITRTIWIVLFLAGIAMTIHNTVENTLEYISWPIKTDLTIDYSSLTFPMVTICNVNPVKRSYYKNLPDDVKEFLESLKQDRLQRNDTITDIPHERKKRFIDTNQLNQNKSYLPTGYTDYEKDTLGGSKDTANYIQDTFAYLYGSLNRSTQREIGHELSEMMLSCSFETRECVKTDFTHMQSSTYGNCFSFNPKSKYTSQRSGQQYGLSLVMYLELDEYVMGLVGGYGIRVTISNQNTLPFPELDGVYVTAGMETDIGIRMLNITRLGTPYGVCMKKDSYIESYGVSYTRQFCHYTCEHRYIEGNCSCFQQAFSRYYENDARNRIKPCRSDKEITCMTKILTQRLKGQLVCDCPSPCQEHSFDTQISSRLWPTENIMNSLIDKVCREDIEKKDVKNCNRLIKSNDIYKLKNFLKMNIFYRDLNFQTVAEIPSYPWYTFLADLGGVVGLYLGLSVLGLFEIIHLLIIIIHHSYMKMKLAGQRKHRSIQDDSVNHKNTVFSNEGL